MSDEEVKMENSEEQYGFMQALLLEIITSPLNLILLFICALLVYMIYRSSDSQGREVTPPPKAPKLKKQDMMLEQLKQHDGTGEHGHVCIAVNGKIFDVTRGKSFYGPGGPYSAFAGHDATRALATFNVRDVKDDYDDLSDLSSMQMDSVREWEMQFTEKYDYVGKLLKPGEQPTEYSEDEESKDKESSSKKDD